MASASEPARPAQPARPHRCVISGLRWQRATLTIELTFTDAGAVTDADIAFRMVDEERRYPLESHDRGDGRHEIVIVMPRFDERAQIPNGSWLIQAVIDGEVGPAVECEPDRLGDLDDASRIFRYAGNHGALTVSFGISETPDPLEFVMRTYVMVRPGAKKRWWSTLSPASRIRRHITSTKARGRHLNRAYRLINRLVGPHANRVLLTSDQRTKLEGNLLRVNERLAERGLNKALDLRYSFLLGERTGLVDTLRTVYLMATSRIIILDDYYGLLASITVDPRTRLLQLWHAGSGFKAVGYARFGNYGSPALTNPHRQYTYAITGSTHLVDTYAEVFGIEPTAVVPTGLPRIDWFLDPARTADVVDRFHDEFPALAGKRLILFAPTFRGRNLHDAFYDYSLIDFDALAEACGDDTVVMFRMHHFVTDPVPIPEPYRDRMVDFSHYPNGNDLLHVTDLLITDYSSIIYEYSLLDRPMLFFAPDKINYAATRGFHREYDAAAPGKVCTTFDELVDAIRAEDFETDKVAAFRAENFDYLDTSSADRVIDWLVLGDPPENARSNTAS